MYLRFLKTPASAAHTTTAKSPLPGQVGPGLTVQRGRCAILRSIRTRTNTHELDGGSLKKPKHARAKLIRSKKSNKNRENRPRNRKKIPLDPGRHFPMPYIHLEGVRHVCVMRAARITHTISGISRYILETS